MMTTRHGLRSLFGLSASALAVACSTSGSSSGSSSVTVDSGPSGGPVTGAVDSHCAAVTQPVSAASCHPTVDAGAGADAGGGAQYGDAEYNAEGDDDDCKYHVKWSSTPVRLGADVTFTVSVTTKNGTPAPTRPVPGEGAGGLNTVRAEVFLTDTHPAPNTKQTSPETATQGTYTVGPIRFDAAGKWTVRFHFHESCEDLLPDSPHGHAAFFVQVP